MKEQCKSTTVRPEKDIMIYGIPHAGVATHRCEKDQGHEDLCRCKCGVTWQKFGDVK